MNVESAPVRARVLSDEPAAGNYFVAAYPPFSCWKRNQAVAAELALKQPAPETPFGVYVHVPFCPKKCDYCYYLSYIRQPLQVIDHYLETVRRELEIYAGQPALQGRALSFLYFGGGTPSNLSTAQARQLLGGLHHLLPRDGAREITYECAPRSVRPNFLDALAEQGVNRLSMGVQSFDDDLLRLNGRVHLAEDVAHAYEHMTRAGFAWINLDLMVGLIGETDTQWRETVRRMLDLSPDSVTIYQTEMPHNTKLYRDYTAGALPAKPVSWDVKRARLDYGFRELERAGYTVVNAYAAVKDPERHRCIYQEHLWRGGDMLGLGVSSFSYFQGVHYQNLCTLEAYESAVDEGRLPVERARDLSDWDQLVREFILQLKFGRVAAAWFQQRFELDITKVFKLRLRALEAEGFLTVTPQEVRLTREGLLCVDRLLPLFYDEEYQGAGYW
ncbi:MAG: coproporphyrinogen-III oxidase family protein [Verrucomicrobiota bacterium]